jgi:hypothetical protein
MPFTFSHPALVLPFSKKWFSLTALVAGSIAPDFEYFFRLKAHAEYSHDWDGLFWFDLPLALFLMWIYNRFVKNKLIDHLPSYFNRRLSPLKNSGKRFFKHHWIIIIISVLIGGASHIIWDSFTHLDGFFASMVPLMAKWVEVYGFTFPISFILQVVSSVIGLLIIFISIAGMPVGQLTNTGNNVTRYWVKIIAAGLLVLIIRFPTGLMSTGFVGDVIDTFIAGALTGLLVVTFTTKPATPTPKVDTGYVSTSSPFGRVPQ